MTPIRELSPRWAKETLTLAFALLALWPFAVGAAGKNPATLPPKGAQDQARSSEIATEARDPRKILVPRGALLFPWDPLRKRWFVSGRADVGFLFFRPRVSFGYGLPHHTWAGLDLIPMISGTQGGGYAGVRWRLPRFEIRSGFLISAAFSRGYFEPAPSYDGRDLETRDDRVAIFWAWESELTVSAPIGPGFGQSETQLLYVMDAEQDTYVFAETMGVVVAPPWAIREQVRYTIPVSGIPGLFVGPALEAVVVPLRDEKWVLRAGLVARFRLYQDMEVRTDVLPTIYSPDTFGRSGSPWFTISARFSWASN